MLFLYFTLMLLLMIRLIVSIISLLLLLYKSELGVLSLLGFSLVHVGLFATSFSSGWECMYGDVDTMHTNFI